MCEACIIRRIQDENTTLRTQNYLLREAVLYDRGAEYLEEIIGKPAAKKDARDIK